ncbi:MAG: hypothetical protein HKN08_01530 [Gammaproteobacteria bacterium]|nr:hypothetical protein [Gammaproteobacteria bacterium]
MIKLKQLLLGIGMGLLLSASVSAQQGDFPKRWMTASEVVQQYGEPISKSDPVGRPVITFWEYMTFVVFFEEDRVLHSIRK